MRYLYNIAWVPAGTPFLFPSRCVASSTDDKADPPKKEATTKFIL